VTRRLLTLAILLAACGDDATGIDGGTDAAPRDGGPPPADGGAPDADGGPPPGDSGPVPVAVPFDCDVLDPVSPSAIDIRDHGAACDGVTDDRGAVQAALDAVPDGGTVVVPCLAAIGAGVTLGSRTGVRVVGTDGGGLAALAASGQFVASGMGPVMLLADACDDCVIEGLLLDGQEHDIAGFGAQGSRGLTFRRNRVTRVGAPAGGGVSVATNVDSRYLCNEIVDVDPDTPLANGTRGMWIGNTSFEEVRPVVGGNLVRNSGGTGIAGHYVGGVISGNTVEDAGRGGAACIKRVPQDGSTEPSIVEENVVRRCGGQGLQFEGGHDVTVRGNAIEVATAAGMYVQVGFESSRIEHNRVHDVRSFVEGGWQGGIHVARADRVVIERNELGDTREGGARTQDHGVLLYPGPIADLVVRDNACDDHTENGIGTGTISGPLTGLVVVGNRCTGNAGFGLRIARLGSGQPFTACASDNDFTGNGAGEISTDISLPTCPPATPLLGITTTTLPDGGVGRPYAARVAAAGGTAPTTFSAAAGRLPAGITLSPDGALGGTPERPGRYRIPFYGYDAGSPARSDRREIELVVLP
jgi:hypothetical protein